VHGVWGSAEDARAAKLYEQPSLRAQARLGAAWIRSFWNVPGWRRDVLPSLFTPAWATRLRHSPSRNRLARTRELDPTRDRLRLAGDLPGQVAPGEVRQILVQVHNEGHRRLPATGPHAVGLWHRWGTSKSSLTPEQLGLNALAAAPVALPRAVAPGRSVPVWIALFAPPRPGTYTLVVAAHQHGLGWLDLTGVASPLERAVDVA
jgi:hypothetical protein